MNETPEDIDPLLDEGIPEGDDPDDLEGDWDDPSDIEDVEDEDESHLDPEVNSDDADEE